MSPAKDRRVQGIDAGIGDLTLRTGKKLSDITIEVGGGITPTPALHRTIEGASTLTVPIYDPDRSFLQHSLLSQKFDTELDGLHFRYVALNKTGKNLTLTLEDRDVAKIREWAGPKRAFREEITRAEFVKALVHEAHPKLDFYCPQLHVKQPIEKKGQAKKAKDEAQANRGKGIGDAKGLTVKGHAASKEQIALGEDALRIAESVHAPLKVTLALIESLIVETEMGTLDPGNPLQATPASKSQSNESDINRFLTGGWGVDPTGNGAIGYYRANPGKTSGEIAQAIQGSAFPDRYDGVSKEAREWVETMEGGETGSTTVTEPYEFKVAKNETYWAAIQRLAKEVNWRAFIVAGKFFFIDEIELSRGEVRLAIDPDTDGVEDVDFEYDVGQSITEATVPVRVKKWGVPPGAVVTLEGYGPASIGTGEAPPKPDSKGRVQAVSRALPAKTFEGRGRYLVSSIETPIGGDAESRLATVTLKRPTKPLPEPANETSTVTTGDEGTVDAGGGPDVQRVKDFCEREIGKPYIWGGFGPTGYDCSGFVSKALTVGGFADGQMDTLGLAVWGEAGEGEFITVHDKAHTGDPHTEHVLIEVLGTIFECGGISGGVGKPNYSKSELAAFSTKRHPPGE